jgi:purine-binding chemotaxis protein CheW
MKIKNIAIQSDFLVDPPVDGGIADSRNDLIRHALICENIPTPLLVTLLSDSSVVYANKQAAGLFGVPLETLLKRKSVEFYNPVDHQQMLDLLARQGYVNDYEIKGKRYDGSCFWAHLAARPFKYDSNPCLISIWHDVTERRRAEEEARKQKEALDRRERERAGTYLLFTLAHEEYGINILKVQSIIGNQPLVPIPESHQFMKGVITIRGRVIPVVDLRMKFGMEPLDYDERTSIIITEVSASDARSEEASSKVIGILVDAVTEVLILKGKDVKDMPEIREGMNSDYALGMAVIKGEIKILLNIDRVLSGDNGV